MPLRIHRVAKAAAVIGLATAPIAALGIPAYAGSVQQHEWWLRALHVAQAWKTGEGAGVTEAVLADGVVANQADLTGQVIQGPDFTRSGRTPGGPHYGVVGTGLASLIAGHGHGKKNASGDGVDGIHGISDDATVLSVRVTLSPGDPLWSSSQVTSHLSDALAAGIRYAVQHKASVIELPADPGMPGFPAWGGVPAAAGGSPAERAAIAYAVSKDVVLIAPAGDNARSGDAVNYPAAYPGVIAVGAFGRNFVKAPFSSRQTYVTLTAAGQGVVAAAPSGYQAMNSTWAASAIVAGVAALVRSQFPNLTAGQVRKAMADGTGYGRHGGIPDGSGHGTVDARGTIRQAAIMSPPHAHLATFGAQPRRRPVTPFVPSQKSVIAHDLMRDGMISAGALAGLLLPITFYGSAARRRDRRLAQAAAERDRQNRTRPGYGSMLADPLLDFFGPQHARPADRPASQRLPASPRFQPRPSLAGGSTLSARPVLSAAIAPGAPLAAPVEAEDSITAQAPAAWPEPPGVVLRGTTVESSPEPTTTVRHADVAGAPPWEPAPQPTTALPWVVTPVPSAGTTSRGAFGVARQAPPESVWDDPLSHVSSEHRSLFDPRPPRQGAPPQGTPPPAQPSGWHDLPDPGGGPIYVWNPTASTDSFPVVDEGRD